MGVTYINPYVFAGFSPLNLSPAAWYDASVTSSITASSGAVSQWNDLSGNARHLVQATAANQPTTGANTQNGLNVISFDGGNVLKKTAAGIDSDLTIVSVFKVNTATTFTMPAVALTATNLGRPVDRWHSSTQNLIFIAGQNVATSGTSLRAWTTFASWFLTYSKATSTSPRVVEYNNNASVTTATNSEPHSVTSQVLSVGQRDDGATTLNGLVAEVIVIPSVLTSTQRSDLQTYLAAKWAL